MARERTKEPASDKVRKLLGKKVYLNELEKNIKKDHVRVNLEMLKI